MQIVIEIPDRLIDNKFGYIDIRLHKDEAHVNSITTPDYNDPYYAELQFNVLPKGHGRLIDADRLLTIQMRSKYYHLNNGDTAIPIIDVEHAHTVVPADKENTE